MQVDLAVNLAGLLVLTAWRLTRLIVADEVPPIRWARRRIVAGGPEWLGDLVTCVYCAGVWIAGAAVLILDLLTSVPAPWLLFGGLAAAIPILDAVVVRLERQPTVRLEREPAAPAPPPPPQPTTYTRTRAGG